MSLDEVKRIVADTCKPADTSAQYNETTKQIIYIGIKIILQAVTI